jgi:hypothetical protein
MTATLIDEMRFERAINRLVRIGPRPVGELLRKIGSDFGVMAEIYGLVSEWAERDPAIVRGVGGGEFHRAPLRLVPRQ